MAQVAQVRLAELKAEYEKGQVRLHQLEAELRVLRETMLRISGAIQVLEEIDRSSTPLTNTDSPSPARPQE